MNNQLPPFPYYMYQPVLLIPPGTIFPPGTAMIPPLGPMFPLSQNVASVANSSFNQNNSSTASPITHSVTHFTHSASENSTDQIPELEKELEELRKKNDPIPDFPGEMSEQSFLYQCPGSIYDSPFPNDAPLIDLTTEDQGQEATLYHPSFLSETVSIPPEVVNLTDQEFASETDWDDGIKEKEKPLQDLKKEIHRLVEQNESVDENFYNFVVDSLSETKNQSAEKKERTILEPQRKRKRNSDLPYDQANSRDTFDPQTNESVIPVSKSFSEADGQEKTSRKRKERESKEKESWDHIVKVEFDKKRLGWNSRDISTLCYAAPVYNYDWDFISGDVFAGLFSPQECESKYKETTISQSH